MEQSPVSPADSSDNSINSHRDDRVLGSLLFCDLSLNDSRQRVPSQEAIPATLGSYVVGPRIGTGGMGCVHAAWDPSLSRLVAIKICITELPRDDVSQARFLEEGRNLSRLEHDNIVRVYAAGVHENFSYLVMEFIDGRPLSDLLEPGKGLPIGVAVRRASDLAQALQEAHKNNIVHRDVKPSNLLVENDSGKMKLVDFGLAGSERPGHGSGTKGYRSPEQRTAGQIVGPSSDVYQLGLVFFEMLTGVNPVGLTVDKRAMRLFRTPRVVQRICLACLGDDPSQRPSSAEVAKNLQDFLNRWTTRLKRVCQILAVFSVPFLLLGAIEAVKRKRAESRIADSKEQIGNLNIRLTRAREAWYKSETQRAFLTRRASFTAKLLPPNARIGHLEKLKSGVDPVALDHFGAEDRQMTQFTLEKAFERVSLGEPEFVEQHITDEFVGRAHVFGLGTFAEEVRGDMFVAREKYHDALRHYEAAAKTSQNNHDATRKKGHCQMRIGRLTEAIETLTVCLSTPMPMDNGTGSINRAVTLLFRGWCFEELGDADRAIHDYDSAVEQFIKGGDSDLLYTARLRRATCVGRPSPSTPSKLEDYVCCIGHYRPLVEGGDKEAAVLYAEALWNYAAALPVKENEASIDSAKMAIGALEKYAPEAKGARIVAQIKLAELQLRAVKSNQSAIRTLQEGLNELRALVENEGHTEYRVELADGYMFLGEAHSSSTVGNELDWAVDELGKAMESYAACTGRFAAQAFQAQRRALLIRGVTHAKRADIWNRDKNQGQASKERVLAIEDFTRFLDLPRDSVGTIGPPLSAESIPLALRRRSAVHLSMGNYKEAAIDAEQMIRKYDEIVQKQSRPQSVTDSLIWAHQLLGRYYTDSRWLDAAKAIDHYTAWLALTGKKDPTEMIDFANLAVAYYAVGHRPTAKKWEAKVLAAASPTETEAFKKRIAKFKTGMTE